MLHGWGLHSGIWEGIEAQLSARFRLHLIDLPGHGLSAPPERFTLDSLCDALNAQAPACAHWLGWSLGGMLALEFAVRRPQSVTRLILVAANPRFVVDVDWTHAMARDVLEGFARDLSVDYTATLKRFLSLVARGAPDAGPLRQLRRSLALMPPPDEEALRGGLKILRDADLRSRLSALAMPVLLIGGERDTLVPITALRRLQREYPQIRLAAISQSGHAPFLSHPQAFITAVTEFLA